MVEWCSSPLQTESECQPCKERASWKKLERQLEAELSLNKSLNKLLLSETAQFFKMETEIGDPSENLIEELWTVVDNHTTRATAPRAKGSKVRCFHTYLNDIVMHYDSVAVKRSPGDRGFSTPLRSRRNVGCWGITTTPSAASPPVGTAPGAWIGCPTILMCAVVGQGGKISRNLPQQSCNSA